MRTRDNPFQHRFVHFIPEDLNDDVLYISVDYKIATHKCFCGCGEKVDTPLSPAGWELTFNGNSVSIWPSISGGHCRSHYVLRRNNVEWARKLTRGEEALALRRDEEAAERVFNDTLPLVESADSPTPEPWTWRRLFKLRRPTP